MAYDDLWPMTVMMDNFQLIGTPDLSNDVILKDGGSSKSVFSGHNSMFDLPKLQKPINMLKLRTNI